MHRYLNEISISIADQNFTDGDILYFVKVRNITSELALFLIETIAKYYLRACLPIWDYLRLGLLKVASELRGLPNTDNELDHEADKNRVIINEWMTGWLNIFNETNISLL